MIGCFLESCSIFKSFQLSVPFRERPGELESDVISALIEELAPVSVLEGAVSRIEPEELGVVEEKRVITAVERCLEFIAGRIGPDLKFGTFLRGIF